MRDTVTIWGGKCRALFCLSRQNNEDDWHTVPPSRDARYHLVNIGYFYVKRQYCLICGKNCLFIDPDKPVCLRKKAVFPFLKKEAVFLQPVGKLM